MKTMIANRNGASLEIGTIPGEIWAPSFKPFESIGPGEVFLLVGGTVAVVNAFELAAAAHGISQAVIARDKKP